MLRVNQLIGFGARRAAGSVSLTTLDYRATFSDATFQTTYTFNSKDIGTASADRQVILAFAWAQSTQDRTVSSVTCNTNAMTLIDGQHNTTGGIYMYQINEASGTTANFVITLSGGATRMVAATYRLIPAVSATPVDHGTAAAGSPRTVTDIEVVNGGALIVANFESLAAGTLTPVYNGVDTPVSNSSATLGGASAYLFWSCSTTESVTTNDPGSTTGDANIIRICAASFH